ncbi:hypothetical protein BN961_03562 [Afipia felis]|uniref:Uncharacterized protein n=1 Tax=Afipia felis TaxID=1035 RepID=A0A090MUS2_AFIFE|nr:hypothetical protein BN961_03562 [Afipia felis]
MRFEMIDRDQWRVVHKRDSLGGGEADDDATDQPRTGRRGHAVELRKFNACLGHGFFNQHVEHLDMGARGDFRHHAAERRVLGDLRAHDIGKNPARTVRMAFDHGGCGFVAGRLYSQNQHCGVLRQNQPSSQVEAMSPGGSAGALAFAAKAAFCLVLG